MWLMVIFSGYYLVWGKQVEGGAFKKQIRIRATSSENTFFSLTQMMMESDRK